MRLSNWPRAHMVALLPILVRQWFGQTKQTAQYCMRHFLTCLKRLGSTALLIGLTSSLKLFKHFQALRGLLLKGLNYVKTRISKLRHALARPWADSPQCLQSDPIHDTDPCQASLCGFAPLRLSWKGLKMKNYIVPIIQTILCLAVWAYIGVLLGLGVWPCKPITL